MVAQRQQLRQIRTLSQNFLNPDPFRMGAAEGGSAGVLEVDTRAAVGCSWEMVRTWYSSRSAVEIFPSSRREAVEIFRNSRGRAAEDAGGSCRRSRAAGVDTDVLSSPRASTEGGGSWDVDQVIRCSREVFRTSYSSRRAAAIFRNGRSKVAEVAAACRCPGLCLKSGSDQ